jgi:hypothetical protein
MQSARLLSASTHRARTGNPETAGEMVAVGLPSCRVVLGTDGRARLRVITGAAAVGADVGNEEHKLATSLPGIDTEL